MNFNLTFPESLPLNTKVLDNLLINDTDTNAALLRVTCYPQLSSPDACNTFTLTSYRQNNLEWAGYMSLVKALNYEAITSYNVSLQATDGTRTTYQLVRVLVTDVQNKPPTFTSVLAASTNETPATPVKTIITYTAVDGDATNKREVRYSLVSNPGGLFALDAVTGRLTNAKALSYTDSTWANGYVDLQVKASEVINSTTLGNDPLTTTVVTSRITLLDSNSNKPQFDKSAYTGSVIEKSPAGTPIPNLNIIVTDGDHSPSNSQFDLTLDSLNNIFQVLPTTGIGSVTAKIVVVDPTLIDYDKGPRDFSFYIIARESKTNDHYSSSAQVNISLIGKNDNPPVFNPKNYTISIREDTKPLTPIIKVVASDADYGYYGNRSIYYKFLPSDGSGYFRIEYLTGQITLGSCSTPGRLGCIDYENSPSLTLRVLAADNYGEGFTDIATITVNIINVNDEPPAFHPTEYVGTIKEGNTKLDPPTIIINATDDYQNNITFVITAGDPNNIWTITPGTNELVATKPISYDDAPSNGRFQLTIRATDSWTSTNALATVTITTVNRFAPVFNMSYDVTISDKTPPGTAFITLQATDGDSPNTANGKVRYRFDSGANDNFIVNPVTGVVTVANGAQLTQNMYNITIVAEDQGNPPRNNMGLLIVRITRTQGPIFASNPIMLYVLKNATLNTVIGSSNVTTFVPNPDLYFDIIQPITGVAQNGVPTILNATDLTLFAINPTTGAIFVNGALNPDRISVWRGVVRVVDRNNTSPSSTATASLIITVYNINDRPPTFDFPWTPENPTINITRDQDFDISTPVGTITARSPNNSLTITYYLEDDYGGYFYINPTTGEVRLNKTLPFTPNQNVSFVVVATDNGQPSLSSKATVYLSVQNTNRYAPEFGQDMYNATIPENSPGGTFVITVAATDKDFGDYGVVRYSISSPGSRFLINDTTGMITVAPGAVLDREQEPSIPLSVTAYDSPLDASIRRYTSIPVMVFLSDVNDNDPRFDSSVFVAPSFTADVRPGYMVIQIVATDPDLGENGTVQYSITGGDPQGIFSINPSTGGITINTSVLANAGQYNLTLMAKDQGRPFQRNSTAQVLVNIQATVRLPPVWYNPPSDSYSVSINENQPVGTYVMTGFANTSYSGIKGNVTYWLLYLGQLVTETPQAFRINSTTGDITTGAVFHYELMNQYLVSLVAMDDYSVRANRYLTVSVLKVDTDNPSFTLYNKTDASFPCCAIPYNMTVDKVSPTGSVIGKVEAFLPNNPNRAIHYRTLTDVNDYNSFFGVDQNTGQILVTDSLNQLVARDEPYRIRVEAYHQILHPFGNPIPPCVCSNISDVFVYIQVVDRSQRVPQFSNVNYNICISEDTQIGEQVFQCNNTNYDITRPVLYTGRYLVNLGTGSNNKLNVVYNTSDDSSRPIIMPPTNGTVFTNDVMQNYVQSYFILKVDAYFTGRSPQYDSNSFDVMMWVVKVKDEALVTVDRPPDVVLPDIEVYKKWIASYAHYGIVCVRDVRYHVSQAGAVDQTKTDIFLWVIDGGSFEVIPPLVLDSQFNISARTPYNIIGITEANTNWKGFNYIPVAAAIGIIIGLLVLALILFCCCCCFWSWLLKSARYTEKEPLIYNAGSLGVVNPVWNQRMFEDQQLSMAVNEGEGGMDKTIALHGAYNTDGFDAGDGDVFGGVQQDSSRMHGAASQSGLSNGHVSQPGLVHIEAPLSDALGGVSASALSQQETVEMESALAPARQDLELTSKQDIQRAAPARLAADEARRAPVSELADEPSRSADASQTFAQTTTTTTTETRSYSAGDMGDYDDGGRGGGRGDPGGRTTKPRHSSYEAPVVELTDARDRPGASGIGATLYQPFGITGEAHPQSVISGRGPYGDDYPGGGSRFERAGSSRDYHVDETRAMSTLPLQKEIVFNDLRPESMYGQGQEYGYENTSGYQRESNGMYQGEIRLGTMREPPESAGYENVHETRFM